eukprot:g20731.t1
MASFWLSKRLAALDTFPSEDFGSRPTTRSSYRSQQDERDEEEVVYRRQDEIEVTQDDLVEFATDGILTDINLAGLAHKVSSLKRLSLRRVGLFGAAGFKEVGRLLTRCASLEFLDVSNNDAGPDGLRGDFCEALDDARSLRVLEMRGCGLRDRGLDPLCSVLERVDEGLRPVVAFLLRIKDLDISDNDLQQAGGEHIADGLIGNKGRLQKLNISHNRLRVAGARAVLDRFLESLDLTCRCHLC